LLLAHLANRSFRVNDVPDTKAIAEAEQRAARRDTAKERLASWRWPMMIAGPLVVLGLIGAYYLFGTRYVSTDDAYVGAARVAVSPSVPGRIIAVDVRENELVKRGQVLAELDPSDFQTAVARAEADLAVTKLQVAALRATYEQSLANLQSAIDSAAYAEKEATRQQALLKAGIASAQDYDRAVHSAQQAEQSVASAKQAVAKALADLGGDPGLGVDNHPQVQRALAQLNSAKIDLAHTKILAAVDGTVTKVEQVQVGSYANTSQTLFWLVSDQRWVEANFKENQLAHLRAGDAATITLDAFPGVKIDARVDSFSPGTGSSFALLPPENATGNWVKVEQRLAVRLDLIDPPGQVLLASGLSAHVRVDSETQVSPTGAKTVANAAP
jgi:membrane fusion protein, multidrug efflux system